MKSFIIISISLLLSQVACNEWKYTLAQEWPGSVCKTQKCTAENLGNFDGSGWNLHGVWPDKQTVQTCKNTFDCSHESYNPTEFVQTTTDDLEKYWVGLYSSAFTFREHEWTKHGTCWQGQSLKQSNSQQDNYFATGIALRHTYNLFEGLLLHGIVPSDTQTYSYQNVLNALQDTLTRASGGQTINQGMIQVQCMNDPQTSQAMIFQVYICIDDHYMPMSCNCGANTVVESNGCSNQVTYPVFRKV